MWRYSLELLAGQFQIESHAECWGCHMTVSQNSGPILRKKQPPNEKRLYTRGTLINTVWSYRGTFLYTYVVPRSAPLVYSRFSLGGRFFIIIGPEFCETVICFTAWVFKPSFETCLANWLILCATQVLTQNKKLFNTHKNKTIQARNKTINDNQINKRQTRNIK